MRFLAVSNTKGYLAAELCLDLTGECFPDPV